MKKVFVLMMVKNEIDVIESNINYLSTQDIDEIFIADNLSTDGTYELLQRIKWNGACPPITLFRDEEVGYYQSAKMNKWSRDCFEKGADYVIPIDADEIWYSLDNSKTLGEAIKTNDGIDVFVANSIDFIPTILDDFNQTNFIKRMNYKKVNSDSFSAVAFNYHQGYELEMGNHNIINHPGKRGQQILGIRHYQYRSFPQFVRKVQNGKTAYDNTNFPSFMGSHWRTLGSLTDQELQNRWLELMSCDVNYCPFEAKNYA
jgi:glycosyltransferase involved in cell wall biosynthesis